MKVLMKICRKVLQGFDGHAENGRAQCNGSNSSSLPVSDSISADRSVSLYSRANADSISFLELSLDDAGYWLGNGGDLE